MEENTFINGKEQLAKIRKVSRFVGHCLQRQRGCKCSRLTVWYLLHKLVSVVISVLLFNFLSWFVGQHDPFWGAKVIAAVVGGANWTATGYFPRMAYCSYPFANTISLNLISAPCVLKANIINEIVFAFMYIWFILLAICNVCSILYWLANLHKSRRSSFVASFLNQHSKIQEMEISMFVSMYLQFDGILLLNFICLEFGSTPTAMVTESLWFQWQKVKAHLIHRNLNFANKLTELVSQNGNPSKLEGISNLTFSRCTNHVPPSVSRFPTFVLTFR